MYDEVKDQDFIIIAVAEESRGEETAREFIEEAKPAYVTLIDREHHVADLYNMVNVPQSVWIDEQGRIVRIGDAAFTRVSDIRKMAINDDMPEWLQETLREAQKIEADPVPYLAALRDWAEKGEASEFALSEDEVIARSRPMSEQAALAAANFEMGQRLYRDGDGDASVPYWREAHRLQPDNWTYKRQAWSIADPNQQPTDQYEGSWLADVKASGGGQSYYPRFEP